MKYDETEFQELLNGACNETLTLVQAARLEEIIANDPQACRLYDQHMQLDLELHFLARTLPKTPAPELVSPAIRTKPVRVPRGSESLLTLTYWRTHRASFFSLAGALTILLWCGFYFFVRPYWQGNQTPEAIPFAARVVDDREVRWSSGVTPWLKGSELPRETVLEIESGFLEIRFSKGAVVVLEGPARLVTTSPKAGRLDYGRLVARVESSEAGGFFVTTPLAQLIDIGTEFGVESSDVRGTEVEVFVGTVDATPLARGEGNRVHSLRLAAGQAASLAVGATSFVQRDAEPERYVQTLPAAGAELPQRMIRPASVRCSLEDQFSRPAELLIDGSGLAQGAGGTRVHWGGPSEACCGEGDTHCWIAPLNEGTPLVLTFDLGQVYELSGVHYWNYSNAELGAFLGTREVQVSYSSDGENYTTQQVMWVPQAKDLSAEEEFMPMPGTARYVRMEFKSNQVPLNVEPQPFVGLGEVRFKGRPLQQENTAEAN